MAAEPGGPGRPTPRIREIMDRRVAAIREKWERGGDLDEGEISTLLRLAEIAVLPDPPQQSPVVDGGSLVKTD